MVNHHVGESGIARYIMSGVADSLYCPHEVKWVITIDHLKPKKNINNTFVSQFLIETSLEKLWTTST